MRNNEPTTFESGHEGEHDVGLRDAVKVISFFQMNKDSKQLGLYRIVPSQKWFDRLMYYRYYRLHLTHGHSQADALRLRKNLQKFELMFKYRKSSREELIFDILTRRMEEADML